MGICSFYRKEKWIRHYLQHLPHSGQESISSVSGARIVLDVFSQTPLCTHEEISKYTDIFLHISNKEQENKIAIVNVMYYKATEKIQSD